MVELPHRAPLLPAVPFYRLRRLNRDLQPFFQKTGLRNRTYSEMLWDWFVLNKEAHTDWEIPERPEASEAGGDAPAPAV